MKHLPYIISLALIFFSLTLTAQPEVSLASQYFNNGEYEKAAEMYEKLTKQNPKSEYFFTYYVKCLGELGKYDEAEEVVRKRLKAEPKSAWLYVEYGNLMERHGETEKAEQQFKKAIETVPAEQPEIMRLANAFIGSSKYELAVQTYQRGNELMKNPAMFAYDLGEAYRLMGDTPKMLTYYLTSIEALPARMTNIQAFLQRFLDKDGFDELMSQLFDRAQKSPESDVWPDMLAWAYVQKKDYRNAFRQVTALDRRLQENGGRVYKLAKTAQNEKDYEAAIEGYQYIIDKKGTECPFYFDARRELLNSRRNRLTEGFAYTTADLRLLESSYDTFLNEFGRSKQTAYMLSEQARLEAFYLRDLPKAIAIMNEVINLPFNENSATERDQKAQAKLDLGDYYLMDNNPWDATLLYSQVDKALKDAPLGELARFKNAKLSYYMGDFDWSQGQLDALKASTTELISNDAIDLSVFILDHYGLDTSSVPMEMFARAELLHFQNRFEEAFSVMDSISTIYPKHSLLEAVMYLEADIYFQKREYPKAVALLEKIIADFKDGLLADNAIFRLAQMYENENILNDKEKAKAYYEKIIQEYSSSLFVIEARKHFRMLRGDKLDGVQ